MKEVREWAGESCLQIANFFSLLATRLFDADEDDSPAPPQSPLTPESIEMMRPKLPRVIAPEKREAAPAGSYRERYEEAKKRRAP